MGQRKEDSESMIDGWQRGKEPCLPLDKKACKQRQEWMQGKKTRGKRNGAEVKSHSDL